MAENAITIDDAHLRATLATKIAALRNGRRLMAAVAIELDNGVNDVFDAEGMPKWRGLSKVTIARRTKANKWPGKILNISGGNAGLISSITPDSGEDWAVLSTNQRKARTLHFGAKQGQFGRSRRANKFGPSKGGPLPWGDIPARPFMVITPQARSNIMSRVAQWLEGM